MYKVSIIIPVYNAAAFIEKSLFSALNQTFDSIQYIIIDDCSGDNGLEVAKNVVFHHLRKNDVVFHQHKTNGGVSAARNSGILLASGEYLFFMDADDMLSSNCIELHFNAIVKKNADFTAASHEIIGRKTIHAGKANFSELNGGEIVKSYLKREWSVTSCNKLIKRSLVLDHELFFPIGIIHGEDALWTLKLSLCANHMAAIPDTTYFYIIKQTSAIGASAQKKNIISLIYVLDQIVFEITKSVYYQQLKEELSAFVLHSRFIIALLISSNSDNFKERVKLYKKLNSIQLVGKSLSISGLLLKLPFFLFNLIFKFPYMVYKKLQ